MDWYLLLLSGVMRQLGSRKPGLRQAILQEYYTLFLEAERHGLITKEQRNQLNNSIRYVDTHS